MTYSLSLRTSSCPVRIREKRLWSIQTWWTVSIWMPSKSVSLQSQLPSTYESRIVRFRMITLWVPGVRCSSPWTSSLAVPTPMMVLSEATATFAPNGSALIVPATRMTYGSSAAA